MNFKYTSQHLMSVMFCKATTYVNVFKYVVCMFGSKLVLTLKNMPLPSSFSLESIFFESYFAMPGALTVWGLFHLTYLTSQKV